MPQNYARELKKYLAKQMGRIDANAMGIDFQEAYEYHLASESFELLEYWVSYFGVYEAEPELMQELHPNKILNIKK